MLLADEFFRLAHHDRTGRLRLGPAPMSIGLAAALLGELTVSGKVSARDGMLYLLDRHAPDDALAHTILDEVGSEPDQREIRIWLSYLARTSYDSVAQRLLRAGRVAPERSRRGLRQTVVYVPVDGVAAAGTWARLSTALRRREPMTEEDVFLAGLAAVTGLQGHIVPDPTDGSLDHLRRGVRDMSTGLRELLLHTEAAVGAAAMTHRT